MKSLIGSICIALTALITLSGCYQTAQTSSDLSSASILSFPASSEIAFISASSQDAIDSGSEAIQIDKISKKVDLGIYTYYLDTRNIQSNEKQSGFMLYKRNKNNGRDVCLNILAYDIKKYGTHVFVVINNDDYFYIPAYNLNSVYRFDYNDKPTLVCKGYNYSTLSDAIHQHGQSLYYTKHNDSAIFRSDINMDNEERIPVSYNEDSILEEYYKINEPQVIYTSISIDKFKNDDVYLKTEKVNENGYVYFMTYIKKSLVDLIEEKVFTKIDFSSGITGDWIYYLGDEIPVNPDSQSDYDAYPMYELHRKKIDGSLNENLNIACFRFDFAGEYLYADIDLVWGDFPYWSTCRYKLDGSEPTQLEYDNMIRYFEAEQLYFTTGYRDSIIHVMDSACNELMKINISITDEKEVLANMKERSYMSNFEFIFIEVVDQVDDWLIFEFRVTSTSPYPAYYLGYYRVNLNNFIVEKVCAGEYLYDYSK